MCWEWWNPAFKSPDDLADEEESENRNPHLDARGELVDDPLVENLIAVDADTGQELGAAVSLRVPLSTLLATFDASTASFYVNPDTFTVGTYQYLVSLTNGNASLLVPATNSGDGLEVGSGGTATVEGGTEDTLYVWHSKNVVWDENGTRNTLSFQPQLTPTGFVGASGALVLNLLTGEGTNPYGGTLDVQNVDNVIGIEANGAYIVCNNDGDTIGDASVGDNGKPIGGDFAGNIIIVGGSGNDNLNGSADGTSVLGGGLGKNTLTGGETPQGTPSNIFVYGLGADTITNFAAGTNSGDHIDLTALASVKTFSAVMADATQVGSNTVINFGSDRTITLDGVERSTLTADNFLFQPMVAFSSIPTGEADTGDEVQIVLGMSDPVAVTSGSSGSLPYLTLGVTSGGTAIATYDPTASNPAENKLVFDYTVGASDHSPDLEITSLVPNGATVEDAYGDSANFSSILDRPTLLQINASPLTVESVSASRTGEVDFGQEVQLTLQMSEAVQRPAGEVDLSFNDGDGGTYGAFLDFSASNFGSGTLVFDYFVQGENSDSTSPTVHTPDLEITGVTGPVLDSAGYGANFSAAFDVPTGVEINPPFYVTSLSTSPGPGEADAGQVVSLTLDTSEPITMNTSGGTPTLTLALISGGTATATYDAAASNLSAGALVFDYTVGSSDRSPDLEIASVNSGGAIITDSTGHSADFSEALSAPTSLQIGPSPLTVTSVTASSTNEDGYQIVDFTLTMSEPVNVVGNPELTLNDGYTAVAAQSFAPETQVTFDAAIPDASEVVPDLEITGVDLDHDPTNPASVRDAEDYNANFSAVFDVPTGIHTGDLYVTSVTTNSSSGEVQAGQTVEITLDMSEGYNIDTAHGSPTLSLSDGATATYDAAASNPSSGTLTFDYTAGPNDRALLLDITNVSSNGAVLTDTHGYSADFSSALYAATGVQVGPTTVVAVTTSQLGQLVSGQQLQFILTMSQDVVVNTSDGTPTVTLNNGVTATYDASASQAYDGNGSSVGALIFDYTPTANDSPTPDLEIKAINLNGAIIVDANGGAVDFSVALRQFSGVNFTSGSSSPLSVYDIAQSGTAGAIKAGQVVAIDVFMTEAAKVTGAPKLALNDGGFATYTSGTGTSELLFKYTVAAGQNTSDLEITSASLVGATVKDLGGNSADFSAIDNADLGLIVDTNAPKVTSATATLGSGGTEGLGGTVKVVLDLSDAPLLVSGTPALKLSDGGTAYYTSGGLSDPTSGVLEFDYTVSSGQNTTDLKITGASVVSGASIRDLAGNAANLTLTATEANLGLTVDSVRPSVTSVTTTLSAGSEIASGGTATITLKMSEAVTVSGTPILDLNDGGIASYVSGGGTTSLTFDYVAGSETTADLKIIGIDETSGTITGSASNELSSSLSSNLKLAINTDSWKVGKSGTFGSGANWTLSAPPTSSQEASLSVAGTYTVSSTGDATVAALNIGDKAATLLITSGGTFTATNGTGVDVNLGTIAVHDGGTLDFDGTVLNSGTLLASGGTLTLANTTDNAGMIEGATPQGVVISSIVANAKTIEALGTSATVLIRSATIINTSTGIVSASGSDAQVRLDDGMITGGKLETAGSNAVIETISGTNNTLSGGTITVGSLVEVTDGTELTLAGTIANSGTIEVSAAIGATTLELDNATISGGKLQTIGTSATIETVGGTTDTIKPATIVSGSLVDVTSGSTLTMSGGTIGFGATVETVSGGTAIFSGTVIDSGSLILGGATIVAAGAIVETTSGGTAIINGAVPNFGKLFASGAHSLVEIASGAVVNGGVAEVGNGLVDILGSSGENVTFLAGGTGGLDLGGLGSAYTGVVSGFGQNTHQFIDFTEIGSAGATLGYTSTSSDSGVLTVSSGGSAVASIYLVGHYTSASFHISSGTGGSLEIIDPPVVGGGFANIALLGNYMASMFATSAVHGSALTTETQTSQQPLLTHPHA